MLFWIFLFVLAFVVSPILFQRFRKPKKKQSLPRSNQEGKVKGFVPPFGEFIELSHGECHYTMNGPGEAPLVVLVHGFSSYSK